MTIDFKVLIPTAVGAVKSIEALMPASTGKEKADAAIALVEEIFGQVTAMYPALNMLFTVVVTGLRALGVFKTPAPKPA